MIKTISLFSGAGGMDVGFKNVGINVILANEINEIDKTAANTFITNHPDTKMLISNINDYFQEFEKY